MEKVNITINGDILINFNLPDDLFNDGNDEFCEDDEYDEDEAPLEETDDEPACHGLSLSVSELPSDVDSKAVEAVMEVIAEALKNVLEKDAKRLAGDCHEGV